MRRIAIKLIAILLAIVSCISCLTACNDNKNQENQNNNGTENYYVDETTSEIIDTSKPTEGTTEPTNSTTTDKETETTIPEETKPNENQNDKGNESKEDVETQTPVKPNDTTQTPENPTTPPQTTTCSHTNTTVKNKKSATCTKDGYTGDTYCTKCNVVVSAGSKISATGHKNTELRNAKEATTESEGYTGDTYCKDCKKTIITGSVISKVQKVETPTEKRARTMAAATQKTSHQYYSTEMEILRLINIERENGGLAPLEWYEDAYYFVKIRATEHLTPNGHTRPDGTSWHSVYYNNGVLTDSIAENLAGAVNYPTDNLLAKFAVEAWMNSSGHRTAIMNTKYTLTAISIVEVNGTIAIAQHFFN